MWPSLHRVRPRPGAQGLPDSARVDALNPLRRLAVTASPFAEQNYCESRYHFLHSADGEGCANMLVEYSTSRGFRSEVDMFVAQAVLQ